MNSAPDAAANFCYRHPGRQSFVLCQRCGRTICPECQTQAAVGVICPECMREQRQSAPRTKSATLTRLKRSDSPVTLAIIAITVFVFILQWIPGLGVQSALQFAGLYVEPSLGTPFEPWRALTAALVHSTSTLILHVGLNMYMLWIFGPVLEKMLGPWRYIWLYVLSAIGGSAAVVLFAAPNVAVIGASGAIFGVLGAFVIIHRKLGAKMTQLYILLAINLGIGFLPGMSISWQAHVGGMAVGLLLGLIFFETRTRGRQKYQLPLLIAASVLVLVLLFSKALF